MYRIGAKKPMAMQLRQGVASRSTQINLTSRGDKARLNLAHVQGYKHYRGAFLYMNKPSSDNCLSSRMTAELVRHLESYRVNDNISMVTLESNHPAYFSQGQDWSHLHRCLSTHHHDQAVSYMKGLNEFGLYLGQYNKPLVPLVRGEVKSGAASLLSQLAHTRVSSEATLSLEEGLYNLVSDCGASYYLSRLPNEVGLYLALTGHTLHWQDLIKLKMAYGLHYQDVYNADQLQKDTVSLLSLYERPMREDRANGDFQKRAMADRQEGRFILDHSVLLETQDRLSHSDENARLVVAEMEYKKKLAYYANSQYEASWASFDKARQVNYLRDFEHQVLEQLIDLEHKQLGEPIPGEHTVLSLPQDKIARCFRGQSLEEVVDALRQEGCQWSKNTLAQIQRRSALVNKLTMRLVREAENKQWQECFEQEFRVNQKLIRHPETALVVEQRVGRQDMEQAVQGVRMEAKEVSAEEVEHMMGQEDKEVRLNHKVKEHSLLPVKEYYERYPDSVRFYLNEQSQDDFEQRQGSETEVMGWLMQHRINPDNVGIDTSRIRETFYKREQLLRHIQQAQLRMRQLVLSPDNTQLFLSTRQALIRDGAWKDNLDAVVEEVFNQHAAKRKDRVAQLTRQSKFRQKKKFFNDVKLSAFKHRLTSTPELDEVHLMRQTQLGPMTPQDKKIHRQLDQVDQHPRAQLVAPNPKVQRNRNYFSKVYKNKIGLEGTFVEQYTDELVNLAPSCEDKDALKQELKDQMQETLECNMKAILERQARLEENIQKVNQMKAKNIEDMRATLQETEEMLEQEVRMERVHTKGVYESIMANQSVLQEEFPTLMEKTNNVGLQQLKQQLLDLLKEVVENKAAQLEVQARPKGKGEVAWLERVAREREQAQKEGVVMSHACFAFSYLGLLHLENLYFRLQGSQLDMGANFDNSYQLQQIKNVLGLQVQGQEEVNDLMEQLDELVEELSSAYVRSKEQLVLQGDRLVETILDYNHINQVESNARSGNMKINPHNKAILRHMEADYILNSKQDIRPNEVDLIDNALLDDPYHPDYIRAEEENDLWDEFMDEPFAPEDGDSNYSPRMFLSRNIFNRKDRRMQKGVYLYLRQLDRLQQKATLGHYDAIPNELLIERQVEMPAYFQWDLRQNASQWMDDNLRKVIGEVFSLRFSAEQNMSRQELAMLDQELAQFLEPAQLQSLLEEELDNQMGEIRMMQDVYKHYQQGGKMQDLTQLGRERKEGKANMGTKLQQLAFNMSQENRLKLLQDQRHDPEVDHDYLDDQQDEIFEENDLVNESYQRRLNTVSFGEEAKVGSQEEYQAQQESLLRDILGVKHSHVDDYFSSLNDQGQQMVEKKTRGLFAKEVGPALEKVRQQHHRPQLQKQIDQFIEQVKRTTTV